MRINKFIASSGICSRRKAEEYIKAGMVSVNGKVVADLSTSVDEDRDIVCVSNQRIVKQTEYIYYMLNKPKGYVSTMNDDRNRKSIMDLTGDIAKRLYPIGRLDYDSEGLLLLTNDGDLTYKLTHPKFNIPKKYIVKIEGTILESELAVLRKGVVIDGERFGKCKARLLKFENNISRIEMVLFEGKNREIRKMFDAIGHEVIFLKRIEFASIKLGGLKRGEIRPLKDYEIEFLKAL